MKNVALFLLLLGIAVTMAGRPASRQDLRPGIIGQDDRVRLDAKGPPWDAIGQVNVVGFHTIDACTGTLAAANLVMTAAHCVMKPLEKDSIPSP